jgi:hypothetical protein
MKARDLFIFGMFCLCAASARAQTQYTQGAAASSPPLVGPLRHYPTEVHKWLADLEKAGVVNRSLPAPYRVALPLMPIGDTGAKLMLTYAPLPGTDRRGVLLFVNIPLR